MNSSNVRVLVADDDVQQLEYLCSLVARLRPDWSIVARCTTPQEVSSQLTALRPSFALLDVQFSGSTSLELVRNLRSELPVIFVTGEASFAADAFTCNAVDFVVKPIRSARLEQALGKIEAQLSKLSNQEQEAAAVRPVSSIRILRGQSLIWTMLSDVYYFSAESKYTRVVLKDQEGLLRLGIGKVEKYLDPQQFWRIHRGIVLNVRHMASAQRDELGRMTITLMGRKETLFVARPYEYLFRDGFL
ncbi:MAG: DNA-binding response regulator [Burkholderiales bacterium]|nr:MAG: DNA-binding response regulator [Burkholderiales bacterium]